MKIKSDLITGIVLVLTSIVTLFLPLFKVTDDLLIFRIIFLVYTLINLARYIINYQTKDGEGLYTSIISFILFIATFIIKFNKPLTMSLFIFTFVAILSFIRLKKADYYHDRKAKIWILEITTLVIFTIIGLLTSISILLTEDNIYLICILFFINGFIEIIDPIVNYITKK